MATRYTPNSDVARRLQNLRELQFYRSAFELKPSARPEESDDDLIQILALHRITSTVHEVESSLDEPSASRLNVLGEQLHTIVSRGNTGQITTWIDACRSRVDDSVVGPADHDTAHLITSIALAHMTLGRNREALRTMEPLRLRVVDGAPEFRAMLLLLQRMGYVGSARELIDHVGDLDREDIDAADGTARAKRLVASGRSLAAMGDVDAGIEHLRRACDLTVRLSEDTGFVHPWPWRWLAHTFRISAAPDRAQDLYREVEDYRLWQDAAIDADGLTVASSPTMRLERVIGDLWKYDGHEPEVLNELIGDIDRIGEEFGECAEYTWVKAQIHRRHDNLDALRHHAESHADDAMVRIEYAKLLSQRGFHRLASDELERVLANQSKHREALREGAMIEADLPPPEDSEHDPTVMTRCLRLLEEIPEDVEMIALAAERLAQSGHFSIAERMFAHLNREIPTYGLGWAGRLRAAAWNHDWNLVAAITADFHDHEHRPAGEREPWEPERIPSIRFAIACALAKANQLDYRAMRGMLRAAFAHFRNSPDSTHTRDEAVYLRGWEVDCLLWQERPDDARHLCENLLLEFPGDPEVLVKYGSALLACHDPSAAAEQFQEALRVAPSLVAAWRGLINAVAKLRRYREAFEIAERARRVLESSPTILCEIAHLHRQIHEAGSGMAFLDRALAAAPFHTVALALRAQFYADLHRHSDAIEAGRTACRLRPDSLDSWEVLAFAYLRRGDDKAALDTVRMAREQFGLTGVTEQLECDGAVNSVGDHAQRCVSPDIAVEMMIAGVLAQCGAEFKECEPVIAHLRSHPAIPEALRCASGLYRHHLRFPAALEAIRDESGGLDWWDESILVHEHAEIIAADSRASSADADSDADDDADIDADRKGFATADLELARARWLNPYSIELYQTQVQLWNAQQRFEESIALLAHATERIPNHAALDVLAAETYLMSGRPTNALKICSNLTASYSNRLHEPVSLRVIQISAIRATGDIAEALKHAQALVADVPASRRARIALARSLQDFNRTSESLTHLEHVLRILPLYPPCGEAAALFCRLRGEHERAHRILRTALSHYDRSDQESEEEREKAVFARADAGLVAELILLYIAQRRFPTAWRYLKILKGRSDVHSRSLGDICEGWLHIRERQPERGLAAFERAIDSGVCLHEARFGAAFACMRIADLHREPEARNERLRQALVHAEANHRGADSGRTQTIAGIAAYQLGEWEKAERYFRASIARHPVHGAHVELAIVLNQQGKLDEALRVIEQVGEDTEISARLLAVRGLTRLRLVVERSARRKLIEQAIRDINRALDIDAGDPTVLSAIVYATSLTDMFEPTETAAWLRAALRSKTDRPSVPVKAELQLMLAEMLLRRGRVFGRLWRLRGPRQWANEAFKTSLHPRAQAIRSSRSHRRTARMSVRTRTPVSVPANQPRTDDQPGLASQIIGYTLTVLAGVAALAPGTVTLLSGGPSLLGFGGLIAGAGAAFAFGIMLTKGRMGLRLPGLELHPDAPPTPTELVNLPTQLTAHAPIMPQVVAAQIHNHWLPQPRFQVLGPAVGPLITGHYAHRDMYFPWRTR